MGNEPIGTQHWKVRRYFNLPSPFHVEVEDNGDGYKLATLICGGQRIWMIPLEKFAAGLREIADCEAARLNQRSRQNERISCPASRPPCPP